MPCYIILLWLVSMASFHIINSEFDLLTSHLMPTINTGLLFVVIFSMRSLLNYSRNLKLIATDELQDFPSNEPANSQPFVNAGPSLSACCPGRCNVSCTLISSHIFFGKFSMWNRIGDIGAYWWMKPLWLAHKKRNRSQESKQIAGVKRECYIR